MVKRALILFSVLAVICSCTPQKKLIYFQDPVPGSSTNKKKALPGDKESASTPDFELKIYPQDILSIQLFTINPDAMPGISTSVDKQIIDNRTAYEKGFIVNTQGDVDLPLIGSVHLGGLTLAVAKDSLINRFKQYVDEPVVVIKKLSFKITILGEVAKPGLYYIPNEKMTFTEALGMVGDLTIYGDRTDIRIFRKGDNNELKEIKVDLTSQDILAPENRYVQQDDLIYVKAIKRKALANINPALVVITSLVSTTVITIALILRLNNGN
ncbi:MAG TPA: polysaccharide biosynthesis/export family protein [Bacteroidia bacterium]|nr:polysaccharide biosynthesis/export family protein [Bacteroidia bacterium]